MVSEKPLKNYCDEVCLVVFFAQPLLSYRYAVDAIIQILIEIYSIRLKLKPQIILTI